MFDASNINEVVDYIVTNYCTTMSEGQQARIRETLFARMYDLRFAERKACASIAETAWISQVGMFGAINGLTFNAAQAICTGIAEAIRNRNNKEK